MSAIHPITPRATGRYSGIPHPGTPHPDTPHAVTPHPDTSHERSTAS
ncbi:hypothetical protein [Leifsonia sp. 22587]